MLESLPQLSFLPTSLEAMENRHNPKPGKLVSLNDLCCQDANSGSDGGHSSGSLSQGLQCSGNSAVQEQIKSS